MAVADPVNIIDFATRCLGQNLYPAQATLLKVLTLDLASLTDFDLELIARWGEGFVPSADGADPHWVGEHGCPPDLLARITRARDEGAPWFNEVVLVLGRRAVKGFLVRTLVAWRVRHLIGLGDPHGHYGIDPLKQLNLLVFGTKIDQTKRDQFGDIRNLLSAAPWFRGRLGRATTEMITVLTPGQIADGARPDVDEGLIAVRAVETTESAARGAAVPLLVLDEVAHITGAGSTADATAVLQAATPAAAQFRHDRMVILSSSPAEKTGPQYQAYQRALEIDLSTGEAANPHSFVVQGPSWLPYEGWADAATIQMWPGGPCFGPLERAILEPDDQEVLWSRRADPDTHAVEYLGRFRAARNAYLSPEDVDAIFAPTADGPLAMQAGGALATTYMAHGDPAVSGANFGFAIAHLEKRDGRDEVIFDLLHVWRPRDFPDGKIDYIHVENEVFRKAVAFGVSRLSFDPYNSAGAIQRLRARLADANLPKRCDVTEATPSFTRNWRVAEVFKTAAGMRMVHAPAFKLAHDELEFLQVENGRVVPPTTGPVRTSDVADCMFELVYALLQEGAPELFARLSGLGLVGALPGGSSQPTATAGAPSFAEQFSAAGRWSNRRPIGHNPARGINPRRVPHPRSRF